MRPIEVEIKIDGIVVLSGELIGEDCVPIYDYDDKTLLHIEKKLLIVSPKGKAIYMGEEIGVINAE